MADKPKDPDPRAAKGPTEEEIDALLKQYSKQAVQPEAGGGGEIPAGQVAARSAEFPPLAADPADKVEHHLDLLLDVPLKVRIELGRCKLQVQDILKLGRGSVVELDKLAGDPLDIYVNDRLVARGEVLVQNQSFCVRITDILSPKARLGGSAT